MCSFNECQNKVLYNKGPYAGLCNAHRQQAVRNTELKPIKPRAKASTPIGDRMLTCVDKTSGCWLWTCGLGGNGYGTIKYKGKTRSAHRLAYATWVGEIPEDSVVHHTCGVRSCINPAHLQLVTPHENNAEMLERKSYKRKIKELEQQVKLLEKQLKRNSRGK
jgi:hypothetical protein